MKKKLSLFLFIVIFVAHVNAAIKHIRWGSSGNPLNGLTITWSNAGTLDSIRWGYTASYEKGGFAATKRTGYTSGISFHKYVFPSPVNSSSTIYYKLYDSGTQTWTAQKTYATAPAENSYTYSFCALGDSRSNVTTVWPQVSSKAIAKNPSFCLFNGDITDSGSSTTEYNAWFDNGASLIEKSVIFHAHGNHDAGNTSMYKNIYDLPQTNGSNLYYAVRYSNALFITLDSESPSGQTSWLQTTLANAAADPTITWKIISFHRPFFNCGNHVGNMNSYRSTWWKAFDDYGVDLVLNGHDHNYQRTKPINLKVSSSTPVAKYGSKTGEGRCEIICGGSGASLYSVGSGADLWSMQYFNSTYNFVYCQVDKCKMTITAYTNTGSVLETFTLDKSADCTIGAQEIHEKFNPIKVVPNPVENNFTLNYASELTGDAVIKIFDGMGQEVYSEKMNKSQTEMEFKYDMSKYAKGIYVISVMMNNQRDNSVFIVK